MSTAEATLRIIGAQGTQEAITIPESGLTIGRGSGNTYILQVPQVSKQHVRFLWQNGGLYVQDLHATNGTFLNNTRLVPEVSHQVNIGDMVRLGMGAVVLVVESIVVPVAMPETVPVGAADAPIPAPLEDEGANDWLQGLLNVPTVDSEIEPQPQPRTLATTRKLPAGIPPPHLGSSWMQYLPPIFGEVQASESWLAPDGTAYPSSFLSRYLLIFESILAPVIWHIDNFDWYLSAQTAPEEWLEWIASWFALPLMTELPDERKRLIVRDIGWLFARRGTKLALRWLLQLCYSDSPYTVSPEEDRRRDDPDIVVEDHVAGQPFVFYVRLPAGKVYRKLVPSRDDPTKLEFQDLNSAEERRKFEAALHHLISTQKPAYTDFVLEIA
ncbi:MAG: FHA domain-containing protein [Chloroflexota bacterium]|nr:FHA domain-containing protein [Chloroflexota bacterium]